MVLHQPIESTRVAEQLVLARFHSSDMFGTRSNTVVETHGVSTFLMTRIGRFL
jgi:hypothetical protein